MCQVKNASKIDSSALELGDTADAVIESSIKNSTSIDEIVRSITEIVTGVNVQVEEIHLRANLMETVGSNTINMLQHTGIIEDIVNKIDDLNR